MSDTLLQEELRKNLKTTFMEKLPEEGAISGEEVFGVLKTAALETFKEIPPQRMREYAAELIAMRMIDTFRAVQSSPTLQALGALLGQAALVEIVEEGNPENDGHHRG